MTARGLSFKPGSIGRLLTHYHFIITILVVLILATLEGVFLYRYFWKTFSASRQIVTLKQQAAVERVEIDRFKKIEAFHGLKTKLREINVGALNDPFAKPTTAERP